MTIKNPILPGFNPDPSILRVDDDFFIATSTFEWFPGVQIHQSKDLIHWKLITHPLNRTSQLNMAGNPNSCGIWAPCLSYDNGTFYLIYTDVKTFMGEFKDRYDLEDLEGAQPVYEEHEGWSEDIGGARGPDDLPAAARQYVERLAELVGAKVGLVSVGEGRGATIRWQ